MPAKISSYSFRRYSFVSGKGRGLPHTSNNLGLLLLSTVTTQLSFRGFRLCADMLPIMAEPSTSFTSAWISLGFGLLGPLM